MSVALMPITARVERFMAKIIIWFGQSNNWQIAIDSERFSCFELHLNYKPIALVTSCCHELWGEGWDWKLLIYERGESGKVFPPFLRLNIKPNSDDFPLSRLFFGDENKIALIKYINALAPPPTHHLFHSPSFICRRHIKLSSWPYDVDRSRIVRSPFLNVLMAMNF